MLIVAFIVLLIANMEREEEKSIVDDDKEEVPIKRRGPYGTKKCNCPFQLKGEQSATGEGWKLTIQDGRHNHQYVSMIMGTLRRQG